MEYQASVWYRGDDKSIIILIGENSADFEEYSKNLPPYDRAYSAHLDIVLPRSLVVELVTASKQPVLDLYYKSSSCNITIVRAEFLGYEFTNPHEFYAENKERHLSKPATVLLGYERIQSHSGLEISKLNATQFSE